MLKGRLRYWLKPTVCWIGSHWLSHPNLRCVRGCSHDPQNKTPAALADSLGLHDVSMHCARHTFATRFARILGVTLVQLRDAHGHNSLAMVQRYAHEMASDLAAMMEQVHGGAS